jgi:hypothetical protein
LLSDSAARGPTYILLRVVGPRSGKHPTGDYGNKKI